MKPKFNLNDYVYIEAKIIGITRSEFNFYHVQICRIDTNDNIGQEMVFNIPEEDIHKVF